MSDAQEIHGSGYVAAMAKLPRQRLLYLIEKGKLPRPSLQVPGRRLFTARDVQLILDHLRENPQLRYKSRGVEK